MKKVILLIGLIGVLALVGLYSFRVHDPTENGYFPGPHAFVTGQTEDVRLVQARIKGADLSVPAVPYIYSVGSTDFKGQLLLLDEHKDAIGALRSRYPKGSAIQVGYSVQSPEKSFAEVNSIKAQPGNPADAATDGPHR